MIIAFDPGKNVGVAELNEQQHLKQHSIISLKELAQYPLNTDHKVVIGNGTGSQAVIEILERRGITPIVIDETGTTLEARALYFEANPAKGLMRLVPKGLRSPPELIDDYAAYAIALRYIKEARV